MIIKILETPTYKKGTARAKWFTAIKGYDGKDVDAFIDAINKKPPVLKKNGEPEVPQGWVRYFAREEVIKVS